MKKHKSVISILLAIMMIFTFMPTLAFADSATGEFNAGHTPGAVKDGKVLVEPTCYTAGIVEVGCIADGGICPHKEVVSAPVLQHDWVDKRFDSAAEFAAELLNNGVFYSSEDEEGVAATNAQKRAAQWVATYGANVCYGYAKVCSICGALKVTDPGDDHLYGLDATEHNNTGAKACAASFTCEICGKTNATNSTHNADTSAALHARNNCTATVLDGRYCNTVIKVPANGFTPAHDVEAWEEVTTYTCPICKQVVDMDHTFRIDQQYGSYSYTDSDLDHTMVETITKEPTCTKAGEKAQKCTDCGYEGATKAIKPLGHDYSVSVSVPATIYTPAYSFNICSRCGAIDEESYKSTGKPLNVAYSLEMFWDKHCDAAGIVKVTREVEGRSDLNRVGYLTYDRGEKEYQFFGSYYLDKGYEYFTTDKDYFIGFGSELRRAEGIEIPDIKPTGHKWAKAAKVADATCEIAEQEAMTCTICGDIKHPTTKVGKPLGHAVEEVVVDATCGAAGYTYKICTRCNNYMSQDGKNVLGRKPADFEAAKYAFTNPVVKLGEKCTYEWKVLEESTYFKKGTRAKVCTVCNHLEEATKESIAEKTIAAPKVKALKKKAKVTVKAVDGAVKYQILVNGKVSKTVKKAGTFTVKKGIKASKKGKKNTFKIRAINADGVKATSKAKSVKIKK